ncbi:MAG TPA: peptide ABC transporter permease [Planctomycetaceae bacterium]|nr:peptide ABC transporter permease [Planctomycetaceae bacterium]
MNLLHIAFRNMQQRGLASALTMFSMSLGVALVVVVLSVSWVVTESFERNSNVGYHLIVGSKGGALQLALNTVYYLSQPIEVIPYEDYLELLPKEQRAAEIRRIGGRVAEPDRAGEYAGFTEGGFAIPLCLGDYLGPFRVVGTKPAFFEELRWGRSSENEYSFSSGRNFVDYSEENGFFEAVLGSLVAKEMGKKVGDTFKTTHGDPEGEGHGIAFKVVGILDSTGTPNDRAAFINIEGFYLLEGHERAYEDQAHPDELKEYVERDRADEAEPLPLEKRDLTAVLVKVGQPLFAIALQKRINKQLQTQAISPIKQITDMLGTFVRPVQLAFLGTTIVVCIVSAISILVSIYNSMNERKHDIAVMRALGARRDAVLMVVLLESLLIAIGGGLLGWLGGHALTLLAGPAVEARTGIQIGFLNTITQLEWYLVPGLIVLATLAGIIPAFVAYRTNVSQNLGS